MLRDKKIKGDEKAYSPPHPNPIDAVLLPSMAGGKGGAALRASVEQQPQQGALDMGPQENIYGAFENDILLI